MQETLAGFLGWEAPLEKGQATHSNILAWRIPMDRGAWRACKLLYTTERLSPAQQSTRHLGQEEVDPSCMPLESSST